MVHENDYVVRQAPRERGEAEWEGSLGDKRGPEQTGSALQRSRGSGSRQPRPGRQPAGSPHARPGGRFGP